MGRNKYNITKQLYYICGEIIKTDNHTIVKRPVILNLRFCFQIILHSEAKNIKQIITYIL